MREPRFVLSDSLLSTYTNYVIQAECPHCKGKYSNLSQHIHKVHLKTKNIMCDKCGMTFYHNSNLKKHIETTHAVQHKVGGDYCEDRYIVVTSPVCSDDGANVPGAAGGTDGSQHGASLQLQTRLQLSVRWVLLCSLPPPHEPDLPPTQPLLPEQRLLRQAVVVKPPQPCSQVKLINWLIKLFQLLLLLSL